MRVRLSLCCPRPAPVGYSQCHRAFERSNCSRRRTRVASSFSCGTGFGPTTSPPRSRRTISRLLAPASVFADHHALDPTFTMMNSASIATGTYPGVHGFYGNVVYAPSAKEGTPRGWRSIFPLRPSSKTSAWSKRCARLIRASSRSLRRCRRPPRQRGSLPWPSAISGRLHPGLQTRRDHSRRRRRDATCFRTRIAAGRLSSSAEQPQSLRGRCMTLANDNGDPTAPLPIAGSKDGQTRHPRPQRCAFPARLRLPD